MSGMKYLFAGMAILALVGAFQHGQFRLEVTPHAMIQLANKKRKCVEQQLLYGKLTLDCASPIHFTDIRKLDMRSDNRSRGGAGAGKFVRVGN